MAARWATAMATVTVTTCRLATVRAKAAGTPPESATEMPGRAKPRPTAMPAASSLLVSERLPLTASAATEKKAR